MSGKEITKLVHEIAREGFKKNNNVGPFESNRLLSRLQTVGSQLWVDSGDLEKIQKIWKREFSACTTNNTLANQVVQTGIFDGEIKKAASRLKSEAPQISQEELILEIGFIINCKIALRLVSAFNGKVSVELHPALARDKEKSVALAHRYFQVCPENFIIKIPLTPEGYLAVRQIEKENIPVNFTLGFSVRQNYLATRLSHPHYFNVFLGRLNAVIPDNGLGDGKFVGEEVTLATQRMLDGLKQKDPAIHSRLIAASIRNGEQVNTLAGTDVLTIPLAAAQEFMSSAINPMSVDNNTDKNFELGINFDQMERFSVLWEVNEQFKDFTDELLNANPDKMNGEELLRISEKHKTNLFHRFNVSDLDAIKKQGKIPKLNAWDKNIAVDDLMTISALQSFAKDQEELDNRIRNLIRE